MYPRSPADLTASNLCQVLSLDPSSVTSVETEIIGQGVGILCQLARVKVSYREHARGPKSVVAKFPAAIEQTRGLARQFKFYEREVNFYKLLAKDAFLPSPRCLHASHDLLSDDFLLLLEDLGDRRLGDQLKAARLRTLSWRSVNSRHFTPNGGTVRNSGQSIGCHWEKAT
jgi:hypothetical protein